MNNFIEITNRVMEEKLKGKIHLSKVKYEYIDGMLILKVRYCTLDFVNMGFTYISYSDEELLELKFGAFIDENFLLLKKDDTDFPLWEFLPADNKSIILKIERMEK
jgi:hypothetical protein